jgi:non-specific serine/threonine protein kinase
MPPAIQGKVRNLPPEPTSFVGRRQEVADVKGVLSTFRLVTLTGTGGVGKTRLALRVATQVQRAFEGGVWLVELGHLRDPALLAHTVANTLGLRDQSSLPPTTVLVDYLASRRLLLVLDNCEHLVDAVAKLAHTLLRSCPGLQVLATSREPLNIDGEATLAVPPLSAPDLDRSMSLGTLSRYEAVALFTERATATVPGFTLTSANQAAVAEICHRLDGLPLAIELATARLATFSADEIRHGLTHRYELLAGGSRSAPTRQQTLRGCIEWSYDLCTTTEKLLWARLAVFAGGVELDAAEDVCGGHGLAAEDMLDLVASLVDKSILVREEHGAVSRYRLLDTIRDYGLDKLREVDGYAALGRRHRDWYERLVLDADADWIGPRQADWLTRMRREHPNLRVALEFCLSKPEEAATGLRMATALQWYWLASGRLDEGRQWLDRAVTRQSAPPTTEWAKALYHAGMLAWFQNDGPGASALAEDVRHLAERLGDATSRALATHAAANVAVLSGDLPRAAAGWEEARGMHRAEGNLPRLLEALCGLGLASGLLRDEARAVACHEEILAITEPRGEAWFRSYSLYLLGVAVWSRGDSWRATELVEQSLRLKRLVDERLGTVWCFEALAWIAADKHDPRRGATLLGAAESISHDLGTPPAIFPHLLVYHDQCEQQVRRDLGAHAFHTAFRHGMDLNIDDAVGYALNEQPREVAASPAVAEATLTRRERQVAELITHGLSNREIATRLVISQRTAESHVEHILTKLGCATRTQIAVWVAQHPTTEPNRESPPSTSRTCS